MKEIYTVSSYIFKDDECLLIYRNKKKNDINQGKYIGVGGHIEEGETPLEAIIREIKEETSLDVIDISYRGLIHFNFDEFIEHMYLYTVSKFNGEVVQCDEGTLYWVKINEFKNLPMWEGDKYFVKSILDNEVDFEYQFVYEKDVLLSYKRIK